MRYYEATSVVSASPEAVWAVRQFARGLKLRVESGG